MTPQGKNRLIPRHRQLILDVCRASREVPSFPVTRSMNLSVLEKARNSTARRISWTAIFVKAYAIVSSECPELKQIFASRPFARTYEHPYSVASVSINRAEDAGSRLFWLRIDNAESIKLLSIQKRIEDALKLPLEQVFSEGLRSERLPYFVRRISWILMMRWFPRKRAKKIGTFSISSLAGEGATNHFHPLVVTSSIAYTRCDAQGKSDVTVICDHRVIDGLYAAKTLQRLEEVLVTKMVDELHDL